jgi:hypothetical protein
MVKHVWTSEPKVIEVIILYLIRAAAIAPAAHHNATSTQLVLTLPPGLQ